MTAIEFNVDILLLLLFEDEDDQFEGLAQNPTQISLVSSKAHLSFKTVKAETHCGGGGGGGGEGGGGGGEGGGGAGVTTNCPWSVVNCGSQALEYVLTS